MVKSRLCLREMEFNAAFGWHPQEHNTGGRYTVTICFDLELPLDTSIESLDQTIDYERVYLTVQGIMKQNILLIEEAARRILLAMKQNFHSVCSGIEVKLTKWNPPVGNTASSTITLFSE